MTDRGWVHNPQHRRWELAGQPGSHPAGWVNDEVAERMPATELATTVARNGWPPLYPAQQEPFVPGRPYWVCVLQGGPLDGRVEYLDPVTYEALPDAVVLIPHRQVPFAASTKEDGKPGPFEAPAPARYQVSPVTCRHRTCQQVFVWPRP